MKSGEKPVFEGVFIDEDKRNVRQEDRITLQNTAAILASIFVPLSVESRWSLKNSLNRREKIIT